MGYKTWWLWTVRQWRKLWPNPPYTHFLAPHSISCEDCGRMYTQIECGLIGVLQGEQVTVTCECGHRIDKKLQGVV